MLTPRNVISLTVAIAVLSLLWSCVSLLRPPDGDGARADSYGTYAHGHRAVLDTFRELGLPMRRSLGPPVAGRLENSLLVVWAPNRDIEELEQTWLEAVGQWVQSGGHVVLALAEDKPLSGYDLLRPRRHTKDERPSRSFLECLGLGDVLVNRLDKSEKAEADEVTFATRRRPQLREVMQDLIGSKTQAEDTTRHFAVSGTGAWKSLSHTAMKISLPARELRELDLHFHKPKGTMSVEAESGKNCLIAARLKVGQGEVTLVSMPSLIVNRQVGAADNIVVAARLLADGDREVVWDEFFHGLTIRGNPMWLFAQRTYGTLTLTLLLAIGLLGWRESVFLGTPLAERPVSRRSIREYVEAMARFLRDGRGADAWIVTKLRDGVLWHLRREHGLPPDQHSEERLLAAVERRDPDRAAELSNTLQAVQTLLLTGQAGHARRAIPLMRRMVECLSKNVTARCATKSQKSFSDKTKSSTSL